MAQEWAKPFYHSPAWLRNRKVYLNALVDVSGHIVTRTTSPDGSHRYVYEKDGFEVEVPETSVVPPGMCERCFQMGELNAADTVHHIVHLNPTNINDPHYTLAYSNFMRVCRDCHAAIHAGSGNPCVVFSDDGRIVGRRTPMYDELRKGLEANDA